MSKTTYTYGPWYHGFSDGTGAGYILATQEPGEERPTVVVSGGTDDWGVTHGVRRVEDARLIVEAPKLLELVQELLPDNGIMTQERLNRWLKDARATVARVVGA